MGVRLEPLAGGDLEFLDELGHGQGCRQGHEKVHMFGHAANAVKMPSLVLSKTKYVGVELSFVFLHDGGDAAVRAKDNMVISLCVTHNFVYSFCIILF